jgi:hypothetical protein
VGAKDFKLTLNVYFDQLNSFLLTQSILKLPSLSPQFSRQAMSRRNPSVLNRHTLRYPSLHSLSIVLHMQSLPLAQMTSSIFVLLLS